MAIVDIFLVNINSLTKRQLAHFTERLLLWVRTYGICRQTAQTEVPDTAQSVLLILWISYLNLDHIPNDHAYERLGFLSYEPLFCSKIRGEERTGASLLASSRSFAFFSLAEFRANIIYLIFSPF